MSITEAGLVRLCRIAQKDLALKTPFIEQGSDVIKRAIKYLQDEAKVDSMRQGYYKTPADDLRNLRNAITHSEGCIQGRRDEEDIQKFVSSESNVEIDERMFIVLSDRFVGLNAHGMQTFLLALHGKLRRMFLRSA